MSGHLMLVVRSAGGVASTSRRPLQTTTSGTRVKPRRGGVNSGGSDTCRAKWSERYLWRFERLGVPFSDGLPPEGGELATLRFVRKGLSASAAALTHSARASARRAT